MKAFGPTEPDPAVMAWLRGRLDNAFGIVDRFAVSSRAGGRDLAASGAGVSARCSGPPIARSEDQSNLIPVRLANAAYVSTCCLRSAVNAAGGATVMTAPSSASLLRIAGVPSARMISLPMVLTSAAGVRAGATKPKKPTSSKPGRVSAIAGICG